MKALLQRVSEASVTIEGAVVGRIGTGLLVLFCAERDDADAAVGKLAQKIAKLRIFPDADGRMNRSILDAGGAVLAVSQFTLAADTSRGNRPGFSRAAAPDEGARLYDAFCAALRAHGLPVETGRFGAQMAVALVNDGPVTIWLEA